MARSTRVTNPLDEGRERAEMPNDETGSSAMRPARIAQDFVHATNPENGLEVVFKMGELLPPWAKESAS